MEVTTFFFILILHSTYKNYELFSLHNTIWENMISAWFDITKLIQQYPMLNNMPFWFCDLKIVKPFVHHEAIALNHSFPAAELLVAVPSMLLCDSNFLLGLIIFFHHNQIYSATYNKLISHAHSMLYSLF
jgi:hypothetical protein